MEKKRTKPLDATTGMAVSGAASPMFGMVSGNPAAFVIGAVSLNVSFLI